MIYMNIVLKNCARTIATRNFTTKRWLSVSSTVCHQQKFKNTRETKYKLQDKIPSDFSLVYKAPMEYYLAVSKHFTNFSVLCVSSSMLYRYLNDLNLIELANVPNYGGLTTTPTEMGIMGLGFLAMALTIQIFVSRYPLRIYRNEDDYVAVFEGNLPTLKYQISFKRGEVVEMPITGILPWRDARYKMNDKRVLLLVNNFKTPSELHNMKGSN